MFPNRDVCPAPRAAAQEILSFTTTLGQTYKPVYPTAKNQLFTELQFLLAGVSKRLPGTMLEALLGSDLRQRLMVSSLNIYIRVSNKAVLSLMLEDYV